nr:MAG TPA: hypothetical protein [Caudoviricetes sp.]
MLFLLSWRSLCLLYVVLHCSPQHSVNGIPSQLAGNAELLQQLPPNLNRLICHMLRIPFIVAGPLCCRYLAFLVHRITSNSNYYGT